MLVGGWKIYKDKEAQDTDFGIQDKIKNRNDICINGVNINQQITLPRHVGVIH